MCVVLRILGAPRPRLPAPGPSVIRRGTEVAPTASTTASRRRPTVTGCRRAYARAVAGSGRWWAEAWSWARTAVVGSWDRWRADQHGAVAALVDDLLRSPATGAGEDLGSVVGALVEHRVGGCAHGCAVVTWDAGTRGGGSTQRWWATPALEHAPGPPRADDLLLAWDGEVVGYLRRRSPDAGAAPPEDVLVLVALVLHHARTARRVAALRRETAAARVELADRRSRTAAGMDQVRRDLEADLHDGAQGDLVGMSMHLAAVEARAARGQHDAGTAEVLRGRAAGLRERLVRTAEGLTLPSLARGGLGVALRESLLDLGPGRLHVDVHDLDRRRFPPGVEATVHHLCTEAVVNARKHAPGSDVTVTVRATHGGVELAVDDTGPGFDGPAPPGAFRAMSARAGAARGTLRVQSSRSGGTRVRGFVPC